MQQHKTPIGLALLVLVQGLVFALVRWLLDLPPLPARLRARWQWALRKAFWNNLARLKFRGSRKQGFPIPRGSPRKITPVDFTAKFPSIPIRNIKVADHIPWDELRSLHEWLMRIFPGFQVFMYRILSPMQPGLDEIDADPYEALKQAYPKRHAALFEPPMMPLEFQGSLDLGALAVKGPYARYLQKYRGDTSADAEWRVDNLAAPYDDFYEWDFRDLDEYEYREGLYKLGCRILFVADRATRTVKPIRIKSELGVSKPGDATWEFAKKLALCAATNHLSLVRHFNGIHLASAAHLAIATRNHLYPDHVLCRLLWPYIYHTQLSNQVVTRAQMVEGGDFDSIFSFTQQGICSLFSATYREYKFTVNDPEEDARRRNIQKPCPFDTPTQDDFQEIHNLFRRHAEKYLNIYYTDTILQKDAAVLNWLDTLNHAENGIPNGLPVTRSNVTIANLSGLLASFMYLVTVQHEICGSFVWNYQLWAHKQPPRLYRNGQRLPLDVYQRLINANFNLNVPRTPLMWKEPEDNWSYLASEQCGQQSEAKKVWRELQDELATLEKEWRARDPWYVWRVYPSMLEVNIND